MTYSPLFLTIPTLCCLISVKAFSAGKVWRDPVSRPRSTNLQFSSSLNPTTTSYEKNEKEEGNEDFEDLLKLPRHPNKSVNQILEETESVVEAMYKFSKEKNEGKSIEDAKEDGRLHEKVYANNYVDLGKVDTIGFDFDYTLVTYTEELLELIYDMALKRLVNDKQYPTEMVSHSHASNLQLFIREMCLLTLLFSLTLQLFISIHSSGMYIPCINPCIVVIPY